MGLHIPYSMIIFWLYQTGTYKTMTWKFCWIVANLPKRQKIIVLKHYYHPFTKKKELFSWSRKYKFYLKDILFLKFGWVLRQRNDWLNGQIDRQPNSYYSYCSVLPPKPTTCHHPHHLLPLLLYKFQSFFSPPCFTWQPFVLS